MLNLYHIYQEGRLGYDTFEGAIVAAKSEDEARTIHPSGNQDFWKYSDDWVKKPEDVKVEYLGKAGPLVQKGVILASNTGS